MSAPRAAASALLLLLAAAALSPPAAAQPAGAPPAAAAPEDGTRDRPAAAPAPAAVPSTPSAAPGGGTGPSPAAGAALSTEGQALGRLRDAGYDDVSGLRRDASGDWRGRARRNGQAVEVILGSDGKVSEGG